MDSSTLYRAAISAGVFVGVCMVAGGAGVPFSTYAKAAGVQVAASLGSDRIHKMTSMEPTTVTSAIATGALYTVTQHFLLGDKNDVTNDFVSAGSEAGARTIEGWGRSAPSDMASNGDDYY